MAHLLRGRPGWVHGLLAAAALACLADLPAAAHGPLHGQILAVSKEIETQPRNAELYLKRGELHRVHEDWDAAQADFDTAAALKPGIENLDWLRGRLFYEAGWNLSAKAALDRFLARHTNHVDALILRGRLLARTGQRLAAAEDYARALGLLAEPAPELFIERAQVLAAEGEAHYAAALLTLDDGMKRLGPIVTLQLFAIDLETKRKHFEAALARLEQVAARLPRKETWLAKRGEILQQAGRAAEARAAFKSALEALEKLPPARRNAPAMLELEKRLHAQLEPPPPPAPATQP